MRCATFSDHSTKTGIAAGNARMQRLRVLAGLLLAAAALALCATFVMPQRAHAETVYSSAQLLRSTDSNITLGCNITLDSYWELSQDRRVKLDLNGYTLTRGLTEEKRWGCVIYMARDAQLTICDGIGGGKITGGYGKNCAGGIHASRGNRIWVNGGSIEGNQSSWDGGGVYLGSGTYLFLNGGSITANKAIDCDGGGVHAGKDSKFFMYSGQLSNNTATDNMGGGVYVNKANAIVYGGTISGNSALRGGAFFQNQRSMSVVGGTFTNNIAQDSSGRQVATTSGGAIAAIDATVEVSGATFEGSKAYYGAAISMISDADATLKNVTVQGCTSSSGAVSAIEQSSLRMTNCTVRNNKGTYASAIFAATENNSFDSCTITGNSRVEGGTYYAAVYSGTKSFDATLNFSGTTIIDGNDNGADYAILAGKIRLDSSDKVVIGDAGVCVRDGIDCADLSNVATRVTVAYPTGKPWSWKDSWAFASFSRESDAQANIAKFVCADSSRCVVRSGSKLYLRSAEGLRGLHTLSITKAKVSEPGGDHSSSAISFEQVIKSAQDKTMSFTSDVSIDLEHLDVTLEYTDTFVNTSGKKVYRTADGGESAEPVTLTKKLTSQDLTSTRTFEVSAAGQDKAAGLTSYDSVNITVSSEPAPTTVMLKMKEFSTAGVGSWSGTMRRAGDADMTISTASEYQNNPVSGWVQSTDGGTTWENASTNVAKESDGITSFIYHTPTNVEGTLLLRPVYQVSKVVLRNTVLVPGNLLPSQFEWSSLSTGDRSGVSGTAPITWTSEASGAVIREFTKYTAKASVDLGEDFVVASGTQVVMGGGDATPVSVQVEYPSTLHVAVDLTSGHDRSKYRDLTYYNEDDDSTSVLLTRVGSEVALRAHESTQENSTFDRWEFKSGMPTVHEDLENRTMRFTMPWNDVELVAHYKQAVGKFVVDAFDKPEAGKPLATQVTYVLDAPDSAGGDKYQEHTATLTWQPAGEGSSHTAAWGTVYTATADLDLGDSYAADRVSGSVWDGEKEATGYNLVLTKVSDHVVRATFSFDATSLPHVDSVEKPNDIQVAYGTPLKRADLPRYVNATLSNGEQRSLRVRWTSADYNPREAGTYTVTGTLVLPDGIEESSQDSFTIKATVVAFDPPQASVAPGTYDSAQTLELTCADADAKTICYSLDGSPYMVYDGPIALEGTEGESVQHTVKTYVIGTKAGDEITSETATYTYAINIPVPEYALHVTNGAAFDMYGRQITSAKVGQTVYVEPNVLEAKTFKQWKAQGITLGPDQEREPLLAFAMPRGDVSLEAVYDDVPVASTFAVSVDAPVAGKLLAQSAKVEVAGQSFDVPKELITWRDAATGQVAQRAEAGKTYAVSIGEFRVPGGASVPQDANATVNGASAQLTRSTDGYAYTVSCELATGEGPAAQDHTVTVEHWVNGEQAAALTLSFACSEGGTAYASANTAGHSSVEGAVFDHWEEIGTATGVVTDENRTNPLLEFTVSADVHLKAVYTASITQVTLGIPMPVAGQQFEGAASASYTARGNVRDLDASKVNVRWFSNGAEATDTADWETAYTAVATIPLAELSGELADGLAAKVEGARATNAYVDGDLLVVTAIYQDTENRVKVASLDAVPAVSDVAWDTEIADMTLPRTVGYTLADGATGQAEVSWDANSSNPEYDPYLTHAQTFTLTGTLTFPKGVNPDGHTTATVQVSVNAAPTLTTYEVDYFMQKEDLSGYEPGGPVADKEFIQAYEGTTAEAYTDLEMGFDAPVVTYTDSEHAEEQAGFPQVKGDGSTVVYVRYPRSTWQAAQFMGGALHMERYKQPDGTYTYDKTDLRFGYHITLPEGAKLTKWYWDYGWTADKLTAHVDGKNKLVDESTGIITSNLVVDRVPLKWYGANLYVRMTVEYETADGNSHAFIADTVARSVSFVAYAVAHSSAESAEARDYAWHILNAMTESA